MNYKNSFKKQIIALSLFTSVAISVSSCKKDGLEETTLNPSSAISDSVGLESNIKSEAISATGITTSSYYLVNALPTGFVKDGSRDYTSYVQAAVTKYSNIVFPAFPILVNDAGINIGSNKTITFLAGSEIRLKGTSKSSYNILNMNNASNVTLYNPVIKGDRYSYVGTTGEAGMGIAMRGSSNIKIYSPNVTDCWG